MILRLSNSAQRGTLVFVAFLAALILSYSSIRNARAQHFAGLQTRDGFERATQLEPGDARNWFLLARYWQFNLEDADPQQAIHAYKNAVSLDPHSAEYWLGLGAAFESVGDVAAARDAFVQAGKAYPLSAEVSWQYGNFLLRQGELQTAFAQMRRAVQADPKRGAEAFSRSLRAQPDVDQILDRVLPPIRDVYVDVIWDQITDGHTENALKVWDRLASIHPTNLPLQDVFTLMGALLAKKQIADARRVWDQAVVFAGMADLQGPPGSVLWDGGFESGVAGGGFSWIFSEHSRGVQISADSSEIHSGKHSLRLSFDGKSNVNLMGPCHYVPVQPSTSYRFSAWVKTRNLTSDQGIRFQLHSLGQQNTPAVATPDVHGTQPWTKIEIPWVSGNDDQEVQVCILRYPSDADENRIQGTAWVDDVALVPASAEHPNP
jgi:tetratricopeptide (TPR) repeat protein